MKKEDGMNIFWCEDLSALLADLCAEDKFRIYMRFLAAFYGRFFNDEMMIVYWKFLKNYDLTEILEAASEWLFAQADFPSPRDLVQLMISSSHELSEETTPESKIADAMERIYGKTEKTL